MVYSVIAAAAAAGDLFFKAKIEGQRPETFPRPLKGTGDKIWLYRNHNSGFPFGFLEGRRELVKTLPLVITSGLGGVFLCLRRRRGERLRKLGLALILGGAVSNLYDRYARGYVVDYFSIRAGWLRRVVFNLGDLFVFSGAAMLMAAEAAEEETEIQRGD